MRGIPDGFRVPDTLNRKGSRPAPAILRADVAGADRFDDAPLSGQIDDEPLSELGKASETSPELLIWYGDKVPEPPPWLVRDLVPQAQIAIIAGQWGAGKTFVGVDLSVSLMLGMPFAGREVVRSGAILWLAAEGASEIDVRVKAAATERKGGDAGCLPFARQAFDVPRLTGPEAEGQLIALAEAFNHGLAQRFPGCKLAAIVVDTLGSAAGWTDANSSSEAQAVMNMLRRVNTKTGALLIVVDHFGKMVETGVMGASAKPQSAEVILAALSDRDLAGNHSNRRMTVAKSRSGASGAETTFRLRPVPIDNDGGTTCVVDWGSTLSEAAAKPGRSTSPWTPRLSLFKNCLGRTLLDHGLPKRPFGSDGSEVRAVPVDRVRTEFLASYAADTHDAKKKQWTRVLKEASERELVATREISAGDPQDWIWFTAKGAGAEP